MAGKTLRAPAIGLACIVSRGAGAAGAIAADRIAKAEPDGHRLPFLSGTTAEELGAMIRTIIAPSSQEDEQ